MPDQATSNNLSTLIRKRASLKSRITVFKNHIEHVNNSNKALNDATITEIKDRLSRISPVIDEFERVQTDIENEDPENESNFSERESFDSNFYSATASAKQLIENFKIEGTHNNQRVAPIISDSNSELHGIKLPTIQLPNFDGNYECWLEYRDSYQSLIHENSNINNIQKFHYLRSTLKGSATQVIQSLEFSSANYIIAWDVLCKRYNNTRLLVHNHVKAIFNLEVITKECAAKIRKLIDNILKHLRALDMLNQPTQHWDTLIIHIICAKLDKVTNRYWEEYKVEKQIPTLENLFTFLRSRADLLETLDVGTSDKAEIKPKVQSRAFMTARDSCIFCKGEHNSRDCKDALKLTPQERLDRAIIAKVCLNCLKRGHFNKFCKASSCRVCRARHHSLLHTDRTLVPRSPSISEPRSSAEKPNVVLSSVNSCNGQVLLSTVRIRLYDIYGKAHYVRALLDSGSQSSFITRRLCDYLNLEVQGVKLDISGLNRSTSFSDSKCIVRISSHRGSFIANLNCFVLPQITDDLPSFTINVAELQIPGNITLADPKFNEPGPIDVLIGADLFWSVISVGRINLGTNKPILQKTQFGWIISGIVHSREIERTSCNFSAGLESQLLKFWEVEECSLVKPWSQEEIACESHFVKTTERDQNGRFVVKLPLKQPAEKLGESFEQAKRRFLSLEKRLIANPRLLKDYTQFMNEYLTLGHMKKVTNNNSEISCYYMPHHGVVREESTTTKLRVVFDASAKTSSALSMNDIQMVGPTIQNDLLSIILRFRKHPFVASADIAKMYRQVLVHSSQRPLQRILWRADVHAPIETYELNTVTYGTACASFLAIRCLHQLADDCQASQPVIANTIKNDFYVDDMLTGANSVASLMATCEQVTSLLKGGCFELRKWLSNVPQVCKMQGDASQETAFDFGCREEFKTLGLRWVPRSDALTFRIDFARGTKPVTKRTILSAVSQIFDPLGLISACTITAKIMIQELWQLKLSWDETVPPHVHSKFSLFYDSLPTLNTLIIPRHAICENPIDIELHGFSDASETAYGGCVYLRSMNGRGEIVVNLLCAKTKVAPIKKITLPRLELCGAVVLARLVNKVQSSLKLNFSTYTFWCDSSIVLSWLKTSPSSLKTFVSNRVAEVQSLTTFGQWRHIGTKENPADLLSRGVNPNNLKELEIWWHGPQWLALESCEWPARKEFETQDLPDLRPVTMSHACTKSQYFEFLKYSDLNKLQRIIAYCVRFRCNCLKPEGGKIVGPISYNESCDALTRLVRLAQSESFANEIDNLKRNKVINRKGKLLHLNPFVDAEGILRVGGRLKHSKFNYNKRHPAILDSRHHLTKLIFRKEHIRLLHPGPQAQLASIRESFWPIAGRNLSRTMVRECIRCFRVKPRVIIPLMGDLPEVRVKPDFPFKSVGVDYGGPFMIKDRKGRGCKLYKAYLCLFVCCATKAVHLELVSSLTKDGFISMLRRFVSRRGKPSIIYSDNGTNFVGANNELKDLGDFLKTSETQLTESLHNEGLTWNFIPAHSPHFGGLWEAGIKSVKHHCKRVMGNSLFTYEEFYTTLVQIEAVLNSRPLSPLSSSPDDPLPLTPSHFLIGRPLLSLPENDIVNVPQNRLDYFQMQQQAVQHFWTRWAKEYISDLQQRFKWKVQGPNVTEGTLVVVKEDNTPPMKWTLGRVIKVHPGSDGIVRVVTIKTNYGEIKRTVAKVCALPINDV